MKRYTKKINRFSFWHPALKLLSMSLVFGFIALALFIENQLLMKLNINSSMGVIINQIIYRGYYVALVISIILLITCIILVFRYPATSKVKLAVKNRLFNPEYNNPLSFKEGSVLPKIICHAHNKNFILIIKATSTSIEELKDISSIISSAINKGKMKKYAVTRVITDEAMDHVKYYIEDVKKNKKLTFENAKEMRQDSPTKLVIQEGDTIDISEGGSIIFVGKTRSGKSWGITSFIIQLLLQGRDNYDSEIIIVDPKGATFKGVPRTILPDTDGSMDKVIDVMKDFDKLRRKRQEIINQKSKELGNEVKWYEIDMHPSYLVIDEFISLRTTQITQKPTKDDPDHCVAVFDSLLKTLVTMGASAACFVIISIAQASVSEGGLPSMISEAMGTKILFRPSKEEAKLVWKNENIDVLGNRDFAQGDAWFTSNDGVHNYPSFVRFPKMDFKVNEELSKLMTAYYSK